MDKLFFEIFESLPSQGPGDEESTKNAFQKLTELPRCPEILDAGCGVGRQTKSLLKLTSGNITALDNHSPFIEILKRNINQSDYSDRIKAVVGDMSSMNFANESFDLIWSEGAAYSMGFENALKSWKKLLRPKGYMAVSELVWFKEDAPKEVKDFFTGEYPYMKHYKEIPSVIKSAGYKVIDSFQLPDTAWWTNYYTPMENLIAKKRIQYKGNKDAQTIFDSFQLEMDMHKKYSEYYGYGFYIMQKTN